MTHTSRLRSLVLGSLLAAVAFIGCEKKEGGGESKEPPKTPATNAAPPSAAAQPTQAPSEAAPAPASAADPGSAAAPGTVAAAPAGAGPQVTLIDAGADPKVELRFKVAKGQKETVSMTMKMAMEMTMNGAPAPKVALPPMVLTMETEVKDVSPEGDMRYEFKVTGAEPQQAEGVAPEVMQAMTASLKGMVGLSGYAVVTNRGINKEADINLPDTLDPQTRQLMEGMRESLTQVAAPMPVEAVGVGAKWKVNTQLTQNGITVKQEANYELTEAAADHATMKVGMNLTGDPQDMKSPGLPAGATAKLKEMNGNGEGQMNVDFARLVPKGSNVTMKTAMSTHLEMGGQAQDMAMKMDMEMKLESK